MSKPNPVYSHELNRVIGIHKSLVDLQTDFGSIATTINPHPEAVQDAFQCLSDQLDDLRTSLGEVPTK